MSGFGSGGDPGSIGSPGAGEWRLALEVVLRRIARRDGFVPPCFDLLTAISRLASRYAGHPSVTSAVLLQIAAGRMRRQTSPAGWPVPTGVIPSARSDHHPSVPPMPRHDVLAGSSVLLVEDVPRDRIYAREFQRCGAAVTLECCGESAVATLSCRISRGDPFTVVVLNLATGTASAAAALRAAGHRGLILALAVSPVRVAPIWREAGCDVVLAADDAARHLVAAIRSRRDRQR